VKDGVWTWPYCSRIPAEKCHTFDNVPRAFETGTYWCRTRAETFLYKWNETDRESCKLELFFFPSPVTTASKGLKVCQDYEVQFALDSPRQSYRLLTTVSALKQSEQWPPFNPRWHPHPTCKIFCTLATILKTFSAWLQSISSLVKFSILWLCEMTTKWQQLLPVTKAMNFYWTWQFKLLNCF